MAKSFPLTRRKFVASASAISLFGLAGCSGDGDDDSDSGDGAGGANDDTPTDTPVPDADNDGVPDAEDDYPNDPQLSDQIESTSDTRKLEEDEWRYYSVDLTDSGRIRYDFIVRDGPPIDVIVIEESEYDHFENGDRYEYIPSVSSMDSASDQESGDLPSGSYYVIFDNSERGEASPPTNFSNDVVEVEFELEIAQ